MKKKVRKFVALMLVTPLLTFPRLPIIPNISGSVTLPTGAQEAAKKAGQEAVKNLKIDWSNFNFKFNFN